MKKLLIILMALVMAASSLLSGCGGVGDTNGEESGATPKPTPVPTPKITPTPYTYIQSDIKMGSITGGTFQMGDVSGNGYSNERPVHSVTLSSFRMSAYEINYGQWMKVRTWAEAHGYTFNNPGDSGGQEYGGTQDDNHPVTNIEWYDAALWCNALSEMEGRTPCYYTSAGRSTVYRSGMVNIQNDWVDWTTNGYRLPTEAEWEYTCRAGTTTDYSFGNSISGSNANYRNSGDKYDNGTTPVGSYAANAWGLYDMHGNVGEWCWDWYSFYSANPSSNPKGPASGSFRVYRDGSWNSAPVGLRSAYRNYGSPAGDVDYIGFRPVRSQ